MSRREIRARAKELASKYGYLQYMIERYLTLWGDDETLQFLEACKNPIKTSIRLNSLRNPIDATVESLKSKDIRLQKVSWLQFGYYAEFNEFSPGSLLEHMLGYYYVQGVPSMTTAEVLNPQPDDIVVDLAAAPGGKTTHLAQLMQNAGMVIAIEQDRQRILSLKSNLLRCGVENSIVLRGDAKRIGSLKVEPTKILLDAPCSGEGLLPIDPTRRTSKTMADIRYCATKQDELLEAAVDKLASGGEIVYSTCSIAPEENEFIIDDILRKHPEMSVIQVDGEFGVPGYVTPYGVHLDESLKHTRRFLPHLHGTEGFFICRMRKE